VGEVKLDRLDGHEEALGDLGVGRAGRGELGDPPLAGRQQLGASGLVPAYPDAAGGEFAPRALGHTVRCARLRQRQALPERNAALPAAAAPPQSGPEVHQRLRMQHARR
jgi:hypothetical protein